VQPFKSKGNGMGVQFIEPLPEDVLLYALADNVRKLMKETDVITHRKAAEDAKRMNIFLSADPG
jgi:hypothetical protein